MPRLAEPARLPPSQLPDVSIQPAGDVATGRWSGVVGVVGAILLFYLLFTAVALARHDGNPYWFVWLGERFQNLDPAGRLGYDGQFTYYIATQGWEATPHLDLPAYRYQRILLAALAGWVGQAQGVAVAWSLVGINLVAVTAGVALLACWLRQAGLSPWYALTYGSYVGLLMAYSRDLNEPLAYGLAIGGLVSWPQRRPLSLLAFALAALAKEQTLLLPIGLGLGMLAQRRWRPALSLVLVPLPLLGWELHLYTRLLQWGVGLGSSPGLIPLQGILSQLTLEPGRLSSALFVAWPGVVALGAAMWGLARAPRQEGWWLLLVQALFVVLLPADVYDHIMHAGRNAMGLVIAAIWVFPHLPTWARLTTLAWWVLPTLAWWWPILRWAPWLSLR